jgi:hypothetical protein
MSPPLASIDVPKIEGVGIELVPPHTLRLKGTITRKNPAIDLAGFLKSVHRDAVARKLTNFRVDVSGLTFVNSSSIRLFIDWAVWIEKETDHRYVLHFVTSRQVTWQQTAFAALASLMKEIVTVERV